MDRIFWSPSTGGFYHDRVHGARQISVVDQAANDAAFEAAAALDLAAYEDAVAQVADDGPKPTREEFHRHVTEAAANPIMKTVDNPDCKLPADAMPIPAALYESLIDGQSAGKVIVAGPDGLPMLGDYVAPADDVLARVRVRRDRALAASDWTHLADATLSAATKKAWATHRQHLRALPKLVEAAIAEGRDPADIPFPEPPTA